MSLAASPDGATVAAAARDGRLLVVDVASGQVTELAASDDGAISGLSWSPDSAWLAWAQPVIRNLARIRIARVADQHEIVDVTDGRFADSSPVFTLDGLYLAFLSQRSFDPVYDAHTFDLAFPLGGRPYLVPLAEQTPSPFGPMPGGRPTGPGRRRGSRGRGGRHGRPGRPGRAGGGPPGGGGALRAPCARSRAGWRGCASRSPACSARAAPARTTTGRVRRCSASTCASARSRSWPAGWTGSASAATAPGSSSATTTSCGSSRPTRKHDDAGETVTVDLSRARFQADPAALWRHAYGEAGRYLRRDFWNPDMSGVDWDGVLGDYRPLLDRIRSAGDFADLLWEVLGELGTSHAYVTAAWDGTGDHTPVGQLGADISRDAAGRWVVDRVLPGESSDPRARSPLEAPGVAAGPGDELVAVDGQPVDPRRGPWPLLAGTAGQAGRATCCTRGTPIPEVHAAGRGRAAARRTGGCATRTGWPAGAAWSASSATGGSATCTSRT